MIPLLEVKDLAFVSSRARELEQVSFALSRGECLCVVGDAGSGKTLLMRLLCGLEKPSEGKIFYDGSEVRHLTERQWRPLRQTMGVLLDDAGLLADLTLAENVAYPMLLAGVARREIESATDFLMAYFDLYRWRYDFPRDVSPGITRRTLLARAMANQPTLLLCDNLFEGVYGETRAEIRNALARYVEAGRMALVFTSRDKSDATLLNAKMLRL